MHSLVHQGLICQYCDLDFGAGIVKAVDVQKGMLYICTPVAMDQLQKVTTLLQGRIETPVPLLMVS